MQNVPTTCFPLSSVYFSSCIGERPTASAAENSHNAETDVEQGQGVRNQTPHALHSSNSTKHTAGAVRTPHDGGSAQNNAEGRVHRHDDSEKASNDEREKTVPQNRR